MVFFPLPKQARYQLRYTRIFNFCHYTTTERKIKDISVYGHSCGQSRFYAIFGNRWKSRKCRCHKALRRFASPYLGYRHGSPKAIALPTALHPDIFSFVLVLPVARLPCSPGLRSTITPTVYWIFRRKSTAGAPFLPAAKSKGRDLLRSLSLREMFCGFTGGNYLASTSAMWPMRSSSLLL